MRDIYVLEKQEGAGQNAGVWVTMKVFVEEPRPYAIREAIFGKEKPVLLEDIHEQQRVVGAVLLGEAGTSDNFSYRMICPRLHDKMGNKT